MKLNNTIRGRVKVFLVGKAFPKSKEENLQKNIRLDLQNCDFLKERKKVYKAYPDFVRKTNSDRFRREVSYSFHDYARTQDVDIQVPFDFAVRAEEWGYPVINVYAPETKEKYPTLYNDVLALMEFKREQTEYEKKLDNLLEVVQSSTPLIKLIPECAEFFKTEAHGVTGSTCMIPAGDLKVIREFLDRAEKEESNV